MHELGIMYHVVEKVQTVMQQNGLTKIEAVVLQVGKLSSAIPRFLEACFPAAADGTPLVGAALEIEVLPANGRCRNCVEVFDVVDHKGSCPHCGKQEFELLSGREFYIKEIRAC